jgi:hypothetical protein
LNMPQCFVSSADSRWIPYRQLKWACLLTIWWEMHLHQHIILRHYHWFPCCKGSYKHVDWRLKWVGLRDRLLLVLEQGDSLREISEFLFEELKPAGNILTKALSVALSCRSKPSSGSSSGNQTRAKLCEVKSAGIVFLTMTFATSLVFLDGSPAKKKQWWCLTPLCSCRCTKWKFHAWKARRGDLLSMHRMLKRWFFG